LRDGSCDAASGDLVAGGAASENEASRRGGLGDTPVRLIVPVGSSHTNPTARRIEMPRYMVQRSFPDKLEIPIADGGRELLHGVVEQNAEEGVTWVSSYVSEDKTHSFCVYDAPTPEAIRKTAARNELPVDQITQVRVLDPYFYS
jgi:Protein of unknown function (DUF4242)